MSRDDQQAPILWFTGLSGAGKTTLSREVSRSLRARGIRTHLLDAGVVRQQLFPELGFTQADRNENVRRLGVLAVMMAEAGILPLVAAMSPERAARDSVRDSVSHFIEVFVDAPVDVCELRDPVGLYRRYRCGEIRQLSGLDEPYEPPLHADVHCETAVQSLEECTKMVVDAVTMRL